MIVKMIVKKTIYYSNISYKNCFYGTYVRKKKILFFFNFNFKFLNDHLKKNEI